MAKYFIQKAYGTDGSTVYEYAPAGHYNCKCTRLHDKEGSGANFCEGAQIINGITYFEPGGYTDFGANPVESIYYILEGQMTLKTDDGETVLHKGDSFHCVGGVNKSVKNDGDTVSEMLVILLPPAPPRA